MPIIIVRGSKHSKRHISVHPPNDSPVRNGRRNILPKSPTSSDDEKEHVSSLTSNMSEVLNLKVYKISKPNFIDGSTTTTLIGGDIFYHEDDDITKSPRPASDKDIQTKATDDLKPRTASLLQNIRAYKYVSTRFHKDDKSILKAVKENNQRFKMIKAGQSISEHIPHPSIDEVLSWAIDYVNSHEHHLAVHFINLEERIKCNIDERLIQNGKQPSISLKSGADSGNRNIRTISAALQPNDVLGKPIKALSLAQQLEYVKNQGTESFLKAVSTSDIGHAPRKSENNLKSLRGLGKKEGSTSFEPSKPQLTRKSNTINQRHRNFRSQPDEVSVENGDVIVGPSLKGEPSELGGDELQPVIEANEMETDDGESPQCDLLDDVDVQIDATVEQEITVSSKQNDSMKDHGEVRPVLEVKVPSSPKVPKKGLNTTPRPPKPSQGVKYSNAKIESQSSSNDGKINVATQEAIDDMRRTQMLFVKSLGYTMNIFKKANENQRVLEIKTEKRLSRANNNGTKLFNEFTSFQQAKAFSDQRAEHALKDKEFHRAETFEAKSSAFSSNSGAFATSGGNIHDDMRNLRQNARDYTDKKHLFLILEVKWYVAAVNRLRDYMKRMNNQSPPCCLKFLSIMEQMIYMGFVIDDAVFYKILLSDIFVRDDFRKNVVHQLIDVVREGLGIPPEVFVKFLESNDLQVPPELMNLIRNNAQIAQKLQPIREKREKSAGIAKVGSMSISSDVVLVDEPEITLEREEGLTDELQSLPKIIPIPPPIIISEVSSYKRDGLMIVTDDLELP